MIPKTPQEWVDQLKLALRAREASGRVTRWDEITRWFLGKYPDGIIAVNNVFGISRAMLPQVYFKSPTICVRAKAGNPQ